FSFYFFFSSRRRHTRFSRDWSSDVCSSDLFNELFPNAAQTYEPFKVQSISQPTGGYQTKQPSQFVINAARQRLREVFPGLSESDPRYSEFLQNQIDNVILNRSQYGIGQDQLYDNPQAIGSENGVQGINDLRTGTDVRNYLGSQLAPIQEAIRQLTSGNLDYQTFYDEAKSQFDPYFQDMIEGVKQRYALERERLEKSNESAIGSTKAQIFNSGIADTPFGKAMMDATQAENERVLSALDARLNAEISSLGSENAGKVIAAAQDRLNTAIQLRDQKLEGLVTQMNLIKDTIQPILDRYENEEDQILELALQYPDAAINVQTDTLEDAMLKLIESPSYQSELQRLESDSKIKSIKDRQIKVGSDLYEIQEDGTLKLVQRARSTSGGGGNPPITGDPLLDEDEGLTEESSQQFLDYAAEAIVAGEDYNTVLNALLDALSLPGDRG